MVAEWTVAIIGRPPTFGRVTTRRRMRLEDGRRPSTSERTLPRGCATVSRVHWQTAPVRRWIGLGIVAATALVGGCGSDTDQRSDAHYCATVNRHLAELNTPNIATGADVSRAVEVYRE